MDGLCDDKSSMKRGNCLATYIDAAHGLQFVLNWVAQAEGPSEQHLLLAPIMIGCLTVVLGLEVGLVLVSRGFAQFPFII